MTKIYVPGRSKEDWRKCLADPIKHWRTGYSAKALACAWMEDPDDFPVSVKSVFAKSQIEVFQNIEMLLAFPEYETPLPGRGRPSQSDVFVLAKSKNGLVSITVEGKVSEPFGDVVSDWKVPQSSDKQLRLKYLCDCLGLELADVDSIRYQLLHRTASALIEADRFNASSALMMVHSFSQTDEWFEDFAQFAALFGAKAEVDSIAYAKRRDDSLFPGIDLYLAWIKG
ncbi:MAG: hypothetical protein IIB16_08325 [Chloroflexi bacterium]|nr:hypothetical protein [Chloroflexota bacterium]